MPRPYPECHVTFPGTLDRGAAPIPLWPGRPRLANALGLTALGFAQDRAGRSLGASRLPGLPSPPGPRYPALHTAGCALRTGQEGSKAALSPRIPSPSQPRPRALGAPAMPKCPRGRRTGTPAWPLEVARESSGTASPLRFSTRASSTLPKHTKLPAPNRFCAPLSFAELGGATRLQPVPGGPMSPGVAKFGPWEAHRVPFLAAGPQALAGQGGASGGKGKARGARTWPQAERPGH